MFSSPVDYLVAGVAIVFCLLTIPFLLSDVVRLRAASKRLDAVIHDLNASGVSITDSSGLRELLPSLVTHSDRMIEKLALESPDLLGISDPQAAALRFESMLMRLWVRGEYGKIASLTKSKNRELAALVQRIPLTLFAFDKLEDFENVLATLRRAEEENNPLLDPLKEPVVAILYLKASAITGSFDIDPHRILAWCSAHQENVLLIAFAFDYFRKLGNEDLAISILKTVQPRRDDYEEFIRESSRVELKDVRRILELNQ